MGPSDETRFIRIGDASFTDYDCFIAGIYGRDVDSASAAFVFVDSQGKLGTNRVDAHGNKMFFKPQAMLEESLKQQKRIAELEATVERQQKGMEVLTAQLKEQAAQIQKVSAQLKLSGPATKVVVNEP
jgi:septal ring factor EnvC (AmiA/AmiB activator)